MRLPESNDELVELVKYRADSYLGGGRRDGRVLNAMRALDRAAFLPADLRLGGLSRRAGSHRPWANLFPALDGRLHARSAASLPRRPRPGGGRRAAAMPQRPSPSFAPPGGSVIAGSEILPELAAAARSNCVVALAKSLSTVEVLAIDGSGGLPGRAPFDRILLSAGVRRRSFRESLLSAQLAEGGILIYPEERGKLYRIMRRSGGLVRESWDGVAFVSLRGGNA